MFNKASISGFLSKILNAGVEEWMDAEKTRAVNSTNVLHLLCFGLGLFLVFEGFHDNDLVLLPLGAITLCSAAGSLYFFHHSGFRHWPGIILTLWLNGLFLLATAVGFGSQATYVWLFVLPFLGVLAFGLRRGAFLLGLQALCLACIFFLPGDPLLLENYDWMLRQRVFVAYLFTCCAAIGGELIRWQAQKKIAELMQRLESISMTDGLTGLLNRRAFDLHLEEELARLLRTGRGFCLVICDIDHFKQVNDRYGHACGDTALRFCADILRQHTRRQDIVARWGGEEFILLLPDTDLDGGVNMAEKLRVLLAEGLVCCRYASFGITMSAGVHAARQGESVDDCVRQADAHLYRAKREGRNKVCF